MEFIKNTLVMATIGGCCMGSFFFAGEYSQKTEAVKWLSQKYTTEKAKADSLANQVSNLSKRLEKQSETIVKLQSKVPAKK